jgi:hypothetical protein
MLPPSLQPWRWRQHVPLKRQYLPTILHIVTTQNTVADPPHTDDQTCYSRLAPLSPSCRGRYHLSPHMLCASLLIYDCMGRQINGIIWWVKISGINYELVVTQICRTWSSTQGILVRTSVNASENTRRTSSNVELGNDSIKLNTSCQNTITTTNYQNSSLGYYNFSTITLEVISILLTSSINHMPTDSNDFLWLLCDCPLAVNVLRQMSSNKYECNFPTV